MAAVTVNELRACMQKMFSKGPTLLKSIEEGRIGVAVSGGPDSLALCALLRQLYPKERLFAFFVHHNMDTRGVTEDPVAIEATFKSLDVDGKTLRIDWTEEELKTLTKGQLQETLRNRRYKALLDASEVAGVKLVLTGHNLNDDVVTMLYRMAHGSGNDGLAGMKFINTFPVNDHRSGEYFIGHPLLKVTKERLEKTCDVMGLTWHNDLSNYDLEFRRNALNVALKGMQKENKVTMDGLEEMLTLLKKFRQDLHEATLPVMSKSVALDRNSGDLMLVLNDDGWFRCQPIFSRIISILAQVGSGRVLPLKASRLVEMHRKLLDEYEVWQADRKTLGAKLANRGAELIGDEAFFQSKRMNTGQMTLGGATIYPLSRDDTLRRLAIHEKMGRKLIPGPGFLVQRHPPARIDQQEIGFGAEKVTLKPGQVYCWDKRIYLSYTLRLPDQTARTFSISYMTPADVREFRMRTPRWVRAALYNYATSTPGTHYYQVPVVREEATGYIAMPTLGVQWPDRQYEWKCTHSGTTALIARFRCVP